MSYQIQIKRSIGCKWEDLFDMKNRFQTMSDALEKYVHLRDNQKNYGSGGARLRIVRYLKVTNKSITESMKGLSQMLTKNKNAVFGRYPCCDLVNNAIRFIIDGKSDSAIEELLQAIWKADGYLHEDIADKADEIHNRIWDEMRK